MTSCTRRRLLLAGAGASILPLVGCRDDGPSKATRYDTAFRRVFAKYRMVGALASARVPGEGQWTGALGYADAGSTRPSDPADHYSIRSVTKSFTVTLVLQLVRDRVVALGDVLERFIPGLPNGRLITLADLAGMTSGLADYSATPEFLQRFGQDVEAPFTDDELVAFALPHSPRFRPGARYEYCNTNTVLLGMIVERLAQADLADVLAERIFAPLGLAHTTYPTALPLPTPHPVPYDLDIATGAFEALPHINPTSLAGAGAMVSTLDDLHLWAAALGDGRLVGPDLQRERVQRSRPVTAVPHYDRYGLGLGILHGWWGHTGEGLGFQAAAFYDPVSAATITALVNATPSVGTNVNLAEEIFAALAAEAAG